MACVMDLPCAWKVVLSYVEDLFAEDLARLFCDAFADEIVVGFDSGHVPWVARNHRWLSVGRRLYIQESQIVSGVLDNGEELVAS